MERGFKVGDTVVCLEGNTSWGLQEGKHYTVKFAGPDFVRVNNPGGGLWYPSRFPLVAAAVPTARTLDPATSKGKRRVNKYEQAVVEALGVFNEGATGKQIAAAKLLPLNCITPRFAPLRRKGLIKDSGMRRDKQIVWVLA